MHSGEQVWRGVVAEGEMLAHFSFETARARRGQPEAAYVATRCLIHQSSRKRRKLREDHLVTTARPAEEKKLQGACASLLPRKDGKQTVAPGRRDFAVARYFSSWREDESKPNPRF